MADINVDINYFNRAETKRLVGLLGRGAEVLPLKIWAYCGIAHPEDGRLSSLSEQEIESIVGWWGTAGRCVRVLQDQGHLGKDADGYFVPDWRKKQGHLWAYKIRAEKAAKARWEKAAGENHASSNATSNARASPKHCSSVLNETSDPPNPLPGGDDGTGDELDSQIRSYIGEHAGLLYSARLHGQIRTMVTSGGWKETRRCLDVAISKGAARPGDYALSVFSSDQAKQHLHKRSVKPAKEWSEGKYCPG